MQGACHSTAFAALLGYMEVPARMLIAATVVIVLIGGLGLASMMTLNVLERTRELRGAGIARRETGRT